MSGSMPGWIAKRFTVWLSRPDELPTGFTAREAVAAECWRHRHPETTKSFAAFTAAACRTVDEDGYDGLMSVRDACDRCGQGWKIENLALCAACISTFCPDCNSRACPCGGEVVG